MVVQGCPRARWRRRCLSELRETKRKRRIDWLAARRYYVEGWVDSKTQRHEFPVLEEVAAKFGAGIRTVEEHSSKEDWPGQRAEFLRRIAVDSQAAIARRVAEELGETVVTLALRAFRRFRVIEDAAFAKLAKLDAQGRPTGQPNLDLKPNDYRALVETIKTAVEQQRLILGMVTDRTAVDVKLSDWRTELIEALRQGKLTAEELREALGDDAEEILEKAGV